MSCNGRRFHVGLKRYTCHFSMNICCERDVCITQSFMTEDFKQNIASNFLKSLTCSLSCSEKENALFSVTEFMHILDLAVKAFLKKSCMIMSYIIGKNLFSTIEMYELVVEF